MVMLHFWYGDSSVTSQPVSPAPSVRKGHSCKQKNEDLEGGDKEGLTSSWQGKITQIRNDAVRCPRHPRLPRLSQLCSTEIIWIARNNSEDNFLQNKL